MAGAASGRAARHAPPGPSDPGGPRRPLSPRSVGLRLEIGSRGLAGPAAGPPPAPGTLRGPREAGLDRHRARHLVPESIIQAIATTLDRWAGTEIGMWIAYPDESLHQIGLSLLTVTPRPVGSRRGSACRDAAAVVVRAGWQTVGMRASQTIGDQLRVLDYWWMLELFKPQKVPKLTPQSMHPEGAALSSGDPAIRSRGRHCAPRGLEAEKRRAAWQLLFLVVPMVPTAPRVRESRRASGATSPRREMGPTFRRTRSNG